jgi:hypothetical protein
MDKSLISKHFCSFLFSSHIIDLINEASDRGPIPPTMATVLFVVGFAAYNPLQYFLNIPLFIRRQNKILHSSRIKFSFVKSISMTR